MPLRVMTWNLWWRFGDWRARTPAIEAVMRAVDPDVVCLQETWAVRGQHGEQRQVDELADALGLRPAMAEPLWFGDRAFGNAVLSRWPVEVIEEVALPDRSGAPGHRRAVAVAVESPWGRWPVVSTHLDHRFDASAARVAQVRRLLELVVDVRGDPEHDPPVVVGGDLNAVPDADELRVATGRTDPGVEGVVLSDVWEQVGRGPGVTWSSANPHVAVSAWPDRRLDYVLVSWPRPKPFGNPERAWLVGDRPVRPDDGPAGDGDDAVGDHSAGAEVWPSDHAAVVAELCTERPSDDRP